MNLPIILATVLQQAEGGNPMKSLGFILFCVFGGTAFYLLLIAEGKTALGAICAIIAFIILWTMAGLPLPNINHRIFNGDESSLIMPPFFASVSQRQQRRTLVAGAVIAAICAYQGVWLYIPVILLGVVISCWPQAKQLPVLAMNYIRRSR